DLVYVHVPTVALAGRATPAGQSRRRWLRPRTGSRPGSSDGGSTVTTPTVASAGAVSASPALAISARVVARCRARAISAISAASEVMATVGSLAAEAGWRCGSGSTPATGSLADLPAPDAPVPGLLVVRCRRASPPPRQELTARRGWIGVVCSSAP